MRRVNLASPDFEYDSGDPPGFRAGMYRFGPDLAAAQLGATVYEIPPGEAVCPYHYEYAEEEWLIVLEGTPSVRSPAGVDELKPWDAVCFPVGPDGAHQIRNDSDERSRVLMFSTVSYPAATVYPDSDKIGIWTGNKDDDLLVERSSGVDYFKGEANS
ncbi:MAG: cupin domain-containing protein [Actinomycetota bacterium]|nr:cupin domain-containing protein [Actinomycetota bacterium]